ncbi:unnamed protein product [Rotaria sp. Silwood1]|nr:unnamed protein product [Rotaria sp. Silwood1]CAF0967459.1 unnamed protein product [Rotaria sp. Silwood1]CAF3409129.1 unnamed protein product [Rotaria sp. Silwood1]CAF4622611.1 unnamed protein product [Rotaria sp. Silwood1]
MNQSLSNRKFHSFNSINSYQTYEICRQQSQCYLLIPPPQPPIFPQLIVNNLLPTLTNHQQQTQSFFITLSIFITLISIGLLFLLGIIFQFYRKLRQRHRQTKRTNISDGLISFSKIIPTSYNSLTPLTTITNQSPSSAMTNVFNRSLQQNLPSDDQLSYHNHTTNTYEKIQLSSEYHYCSCCICVHTYSKPQQRQQSNISTTHQLTPYYYKCESSSSKIVCQKCLLENLHRKQNCFCHNFFIPIK